MGAQPVSHSDDGTNASVLGLETASSVKSPLKLLQGNVQETEASHICVSRLVTCSCSRAHLPKVWLYLEFSGRVIKTVEELYKNYGSSSANSGASLQEDEVTGIANIAARGRS